jgi:radical SAM protein with 4Fe4S-binding SPASM domain
MFGQMGISLWSVFFLIPVGRGQVLPRIKPEDYEIVFERLWNQALKQPYAIKTTEAHHYRRYVLQKQGNPQTMPGNIQMPGRIQRAPLGVNDGKGVMFVSHTGEVYPSGFMPIKCGKFPEESIVDVYRESRIFQDLRNPDLLKGKCGLCEYRPVCGGSRARAYAVTNDHLGGEPDCVYIPESIKSAPQPLS